MRLLSPTGNSDIGRFVASCVESDYQKYLLHITDRFADHRIDAFCDSISAVHFGAYSGSGVSALARLVHQDWDTQCFGFGVAKISDLLGERGESKDALLDEIKAYAREQSIELITCRVSYDDFSSLNALQRNGFQMADAMSIFLWDGRRSAPRSGRGCRGIDGVEVCQIRGEERNASDRMKRIAAEAFRHSRFSNDANFTDSQVDQYYDQLVNSLVSQQGSLCFIARTGTEPVGFVVGAVDARLSTYLPCSLGYLWLIAVDRSYAGRGIGQLLLDAFLDASSEHMHYVEVGTQIDNYSALNMYSRRGLRFVSSLVTTHLWL